LSRVVVTINGKFAQELDVDRDLVVGRSPGSDVRIPHDDVSSRHAVLRPSGVGVAIRDLGSTNGTFLDGTRRLEPEEEVSLPPGTRVVIGPAVLEVAGGARARSTDPAHGSIGSGTMVIGAGDVGKELVALARFEAVRPRLLIAAGQERLTVPLKEMEILVGREEGQVRIPHQSVSGKQARLLFDNGQFVLQDLGSRNGTFLDGNPLTVPTPIPAECAITFGTVECLFVSTPPEQAGADEFRAETLVHHVVRLGKATEHQGKMVLEGHAEGGKSLGEIFVERGILSPREWSEIYRQRAIIGTLGRGTGRRGMHPIVWVAIGVGVAAVAAAAYLALR